MSYTVSGAHATIQLILAVMLLVMIYQDRVKAKRQQENWERDYQEIQRILDKIKKTLPDK